jgi:hypothetical protein
MHLDLCSYWPHWDFTASVFYTRKLFLNNQQNRSTFSKISSISGRHQCINYAVNERIGRNSNLLLHWGNRQHWSKIFRRLLFKFSNKFHSRVSKFPRLCTAQNGMKSRILRIERKCYLCWWILRNLLALQLVKSPSWDCQSIWMWEILTTVNWGGFAQGGVKLLRALTLNIFTRVTYELLWALYSRVSLKSPQQFIEFSVTFAKIFNVKALCNFTSPCAKPPRLRVLNLVAILSLIFSRF